MWILTFNIQKDSFLWYSRVVPYFFQVVVANNPKKTYGILKEIEK